MKRWIPVVAAALLMGAVSSATPAAADTTTTTTVHLASGGGVVAAPDPDTLVRLSPTGSFRPARTLLADWTWQTIPGTQWVGDSWLLDGRQNSTTYFRRTFTVPADATNIRLDLCVLADGGATVFLNNLPLLESAYPVDSPPNSRYPAACTDPAVLQTFVQGQNVLDFVVRNGTGPMGLDYEGFLHYETPVNTPPVLHLPDDMTVNATGPGGAVVEFTVTATDDADPSPVVVCSFESGTNFAIGGAAVECTATDDQGAVTQGFFRIEVIGADDQLRALRSAVTGVGPGTSLRDKITAVQAARTAGNAAAACQGLTEFANQVGALSGRRMATGTATALIADATRIRSVMACNGETIPQE
ncbi:MAG TPA: hypothetical protein VK402_04625 [Blastococcus sp.]|nr:hypothetical protein [Blastococcus sp.]